MKKRDQSSDKTSLIIRLVFAPNLVDILEVNATVRKVLRKVPRILCNEEFVHIQFYSQSQSLSPRLFSFEEEAA